jgi:ABC-2 type transport system ATP-binding protein
VVRVGRRMIIDGVSLQLDQGVVVLAGPNGSGKTTLLRVLATLRRQTGGRVSVTGLTPSSGRELREIRRRTGYLAQDPQQHAHLQVDEAVAYAAWLKGMGASERRLRVQEALSEVDLTLWSGHKLAELSGGTRRRVHLAQALVHRPSVLLLDEPTTGVDAEHRVEFRGLLRRIAADRLVVLSTHLTEDIELLADRVVVLDAGRVAFDGTPHQLSSLGADDPAGHESSRAVERGLRAVTRQVAS